ncbi:TPA: hypothetical protein PXJ45_000443 [Yersinia enterocolitica]|nr:hypothetical protein [Yersinia enterocolitica]HDL6680360.1 hypothetical protein [Yersinia enterocolitica]
MESRTARLDFALMRERFPYFELVVTALKFLVEAFKGNHCFFAHALILDFRYKKSRISSSLFVSVVLLLPPVKWQG